MGTAGPRADAAVVLLHRIAVTGKLRSRRPRPDRPALDGGQSLRYRVRSTTSPATRRDDDGIRIGNGWVQQLDLRPDDTVQSRLLGGTHEPDRAVETVPVRGGESGQPARDRPLDEIVRGGGAVQEREVGVRVELGVRSRRHVDRLVSGGERGLDSIERMFISCT